MMGEERRERDWRLDGWIVAILAMGFAWLYLRTLCPTIYVGDSGEICTAIATGGVIHPPGYPLLGLLGRAAVALLPWGEPAYRIGVVVALAAAFAVAMLYLVTREIGAARWAAVAAASAFGLSRTFWSQSVRVEVYSLHVLLIGVALLAALRYHRTGRPRWLLGAALAVSLGVAHHLTIILLAPALLVLCADRLTTSPRRGRETALMTGLLLTGPALYLLLVFWARAEPLQAWGRPVSLPLLWNHASGRFYGNLLQLPDAGFVAKRYPESWRFFAETFPALTGLLALMGLVPLLRGDRRVGMALLSVIAVVLLYNLCYRIDDIAPYYLPAWIAVAGLLSVALTSAQEMLRPIRLDRVLVVGAFALLVGVPLSQNWASCDLSRATWVREFARHKLENTDTGGVLLTATDNDTFPVWYLRDVLKVRTDVIHLDRAMLGGTWSTLDRDPSLWYLHRLRRQGVSAPLGMPRDAARRAYLAHDGYLIDLLKGPLQGRPLCASFLDSGRTAVEARGVFFKWVGERYQPLPVGIVVRLSPKGQPVDLPALIRENERHWARIALPNLRGIRMDDELDADYMTNLYACSLVNFGGLHEMAGNYARAEELYRLAHDWAPRYKNASQALAAVQLARQRVSKEMAGPR
jgi:hypothetical protein